MKDDSGKLAARIASTKADQLEALIDGTEEDTDECMEQLRCVLCRCKEHFISFDISAVKELIAVSELSVSSLPSLKSPHVGLVRRRGALIPLSMMVKVLESSSSEPVPPKGRVVVLRHAGSRGEEPFGVIVDEVVSVQGIVKSSFSDISSRLVKSTGDENLVFRSMFVFEGNEYRHIDAESLHSTLSRSIVRRSAVE